MSVKGHQVNAGVREQKWDDTMVLVLNGDVQCGFTLGVLKWGQGERFNVKSVDSAIWVFLLQSNWVRREEADYAVVLVLYGDVQCGFALGVLKWGQGEMLSQLRVPCGSSFEIEFGQKGGGRLCRGAGSLWRCAMRKCLRRPVKKVNGKIQGHVIW